MYLTFSSHIAIIETGERKIFGREILKRRDRFDDLSVESGCCKGELGLGAELPGVKCSIPDNASVFLFTAAS